MAARSRKLAGSVDDSWRRASRGGNDHKRNMELGLVETRPVPEDAGLFAEALAVIRGDDDPGPLEDGTTSEFIDQTAELLVEIGDTVIVRVASEMDLLRRRPPLRQHQPVLDHGRLTLVARFGTEPVEAALSGIS